MGISSDGIFCFGICINEDEVEKLFNNIFEGISSYEEDGDPDLDELIAKEANIKRTSDDYYSKVSEARQSYPVDLIYHCSYDYQMYILAVPGTYVNASRGYPEEIDIEKLTPSFENIQRFKQWFIDKKIEYTKPSWILASMYG